MRRFLRTQTYGGFSISKRIVDQDDKDLFNTVSVAENRRQVFVRFQLNPDIAFLGFGLKALPVILKAAAYRLSTGKAAQLPEA